MKRIANILWKKSSIKTMKYSILIDDKNQFCSYCTVSNIDIKTSQNLMNQTNITNYIKLSRGMR